MGTRHPGARERYGVPRLRRSLRLYPGDSADDIVHIDDEGDGVPRWGYDLSQRWAESLRRDGSRCDGMRYSGVQLLLREPDDELPEGIWTDAEVPLCRMHTRIHEDHGPGAVDVSAHAAQAAGRRHSCESVERAERFEAARRMETDELDSGPMTPV